MVRLRNRTLSGVMLVSVLLVVAGITSLDVRADEERFIAPHEAEILISLLPESLGLRKEGRDVEWKTEADPKLNQADFYHFWVVSPDAKSASPNVGYFAVNKHTGEVWNEVAEKRIEGIEIKAVQEILRRVHKITNEDLEKYGSRIWLPK